MAGGYNPTDPAQCQHYAAFASQLGRRTFDAIYWILFILVIMMLFLAADLEKASTVEPDSREHRHRMKRCMFVCTIYATISVTSVVMEVFMLMALQFCDGEDLMSLYWSTWTMMQVGSLIAIFGILLAVFNSLRGNKNPPWALALGTPVLVVAGLGHAVHVAMRKRVKRVRSRSTGRQRGLSEASSYTINQTDRVLTNGLPMSRENTILGEESEKEDAEFKATLIGYTPDGSPILRFLEDPGTFTPERGNVLGRREDGQVIVAFRKSMTAVFEKDLHPRADSPPATLQVPQNSRPAIIRIAVPETSPV
ncbi:hypothetical protein B0T26DRAFT_658418 [Lasiosphaeria miniovina]|uniref:Uncharacterized protein n=1 Tax=Lasiosphaeria miniovina TaxID=1954250 RepID=A0AA39ZU76_9PEZI|nr:uncharacterized protein B0T26DRAFT_658418 [Lasiosphaeria miniovina]KAK0703738.1 hypothetical protein B0T26DRAFT_658418 [Lasiosphaeria miniovina]